jgi:Zn-dependent protease with chaperone function|tara:strand:- start:248 stop:589 length:342 start_codon:yes stop_codon:yes gene_type:complete
MFQSGTDKILDWKGNYLWLKEHFSKSFLRSFVKPMLLIVLVLEIVSGILCLCGGLIGLFQNDTSLILTGLFLVSLNLIALFFGQRFSKDYAGASVIVNYFILTIIGISTFYFV